MQLTFCRCQSAGRAARVNPQSARVVALRCEKRLARTQEYVGRVVGEIGLERRLDRVGSLERAALIFQIWVVVFHLVVEIS